MNDVTKPDLEVHPFRFHTIVQLADALANRLVSPPELWAMTSEYLRRFGGPLNAVAAVLEPPASTHVVAKDDTGLLDGIPFGAKDIIAADGAPTTWGCAYFADQRLPDADVIKILRRCGASLVAKLNTSELAGAGRAASPGMSIFGQGLNPWNPSRFAGGSSSGSAIAVAIGAVPFALGTETSGSVVGPAAYSGVTGLRTTHGAVTMGGVMLLSPTLDKIGILARTAVDCGIVFGALRGDHRRSETWRRRRRMRLAFASVELSECQADARPALERSLVELEAAGFELVERDIDRSIPYAHALSTIMLAEANLQFREPLRDSRFVLVDREQDAEFRTGSQLLATDYLQAQRVREQARREWCSALEGVDLLLSVSRPTTAPRLDQRRVFDPSHSDAVRASANLAGLPGISVPCGLAGDGLPVGWHLVGPAGADLTLVAAAASYQEQTTHHLAIPTVIADAARPTR